MRESLFEAYTMCFESLSFIFYSLFVLLLFVVGVFMDFIFQNWDTITLLVTNLVAYFAPSPRQRKK